MAATAPRHGGDLDYATRVYGEPPGGWLDLSTGVSQHGYRLPAGDSASDHQALPSRRALRRLCQAARSAYRLPEGATIAPTPGSEIAIRLLPLIAPPGKVAIVSPTYPSHREAWADAGRDVAAVTALDDVPDDAAIAVVANPNNPDGRVIAPERLIDRATRLDLLVVDEAFADLTPEASLAPHLAGMNAVVLRSFGKFYGLPGVRLGFAAGAPPVVDRLAALLGDWPVSEAALRIGTAALADTAWREETRRRLKQHAARLRHVLAAHRLAAIGGTDLFVLIDDTDAAALHRDLAERSVWTRAFQERPTWLRFGLPADDAGFARLDRALGEVRALGLSDRLPAGGPR